MILQNIPDVIFIRQIRLKMLHHLPSQFVKKFGLVVVTDIIKIDQVPDYVVLQFLFWYSPIAVNEAVLCVVIEVSNQNVPCNGLKMHAFKIEIKVPIADCDGTLRQTTIFGMSIVLSM